MRVLTLDIGSTAVKAGLWTGSAGGNFLRRTQVEFSTMFDGSRVEIHPATLIAAINQAVRKTLAGTKKVDAISFCALSSGIVVTDDAGAIRAGVITHADRRSTEVAADLVKRRNKSWWLARTGNLPYPGGIGASTLAWLKRRDRAIFAPRNRSAAPCRAGQVSSLIGFLLTGNWVTDPSQATFLGLWDIRRATWNAQACALVGVPMECLPQVKWADEVIGGLTQNMARAWHLPTGIPVVGGLIDTSAAIIQTPMNPGQLVHNAGSTDVLAMCLKRPAPAEGLLTRPVGVGNVYPRRWLAVRTLASAGSALNWARQTLFSEISDASWKKILTRAAQKDTASVTCQPDFAGRRAAIEQSPGALFAGINLGTSREELLAAILHGLARESSASYQMLHRIHAPRRQVFTMGGAHALATAMHQQWPRHHIFRRLHGDGLQGLAELACRVLGIAS